MIQTKTDLREYIAADRSRYTLRWFDRFIYSEIWKTLKYLRNLRKIEYHANNPGIYHKVMHSLHYYLWRRQNWKYGICINPGTCGKGLYITHLLGGGVLLW